MRAVRVIIFVDSTLRPVQEREYLLEDVINIFLPGSSLQRMHAVADYLVSHIVVPTVIVFSNVIDDLSSKRLWKDLGGNKAGALAKALSSQLQDMELLRTGLSEATRGRIQITFASPPGFVFWKTKTIPLLIYALWEMSQTEKKGKEEAQYLYRIRAATLCVNAEPIRLPELANAVTFPEVSKI